MSTIYDKFKKPASSSIESFMSDSIDKPKELTSVKEVKPNDILPVSSQPIDFPSKSELSRKNASELQSYLHNAAEALSVVDDVVLKQYLTKLENLDLIPNTQAKIGEDVIIYKISRMAYEKDEFATDKFISAFSAMTYADCSIFLIVDGYSDHADFYLGVKNSDDKKTGRSVAETFKSSVKGQFPGISMVDCSIVEEGERRSDQEILLKKISEATSISSCAGVPSFKDEDGAYTNSNYVQGIEKLATAMQGRRYTAIILANNVTPSGISEIRQGYENLYTQLSAVATQQIAYTTNESLANAITRSKGISNGTSDTQTEGYTNTHTEGRSFTHAEGTSTSHTDNYSESKKGGLAKAASIVGGALAAVGGVALMATGIGVPAGLALVVGAALGAAGASGKQKTKGYSDTVGTNTNNSEGTNTSDSTSKNYSSAHGTSRTESFTESNGQTATISGGKNFTLTLHNKHIEELQKRIDKQLERIAMSESTGLWSASSYFFSYDNDLASAETGAAIFRSIMQGETSGVEASAVNTWIGNNSAEEEKKVSLLTNTVCRFLHPIFDYKSNIGVSGIPVDNSSLLSSKELSMLMGLPRKSVPGFPVVEHVSLAKEVVRHSSITPKRPLHLGSIYDQGVEHKENAVKLDAKSLTQHIFVTGSTGCGKSESVYKLISEAKRAGASFLIIEPAKGEYKNVFGNAHVFGTNPMLMPLLRINPFRFPKGIHVLEHIDRLTEIFNVCWPMYAAMPAVLKKAMLKAYENCGWDLYRSSNKHSEAYDIFPSFSDLLVELELAINASAYSEEVKGNYVGSLVTRVESLTNGINGEIFSAKELSDQVLFDEDAIIDLSRVGSQETKALIMGLLIMRLSEYRMVSASEVNQGLRHLTVLEEAHNILKRISTEQSMEGSNVAGKSVEMITNAIAEMRTYGEGFVIVDQSPTSVDPAAIKNTNTKIIMRLPDGDDRTISGKAAGLKENQIDEIAKLPTGVAVVYQNNWVSPVLCKIAMIEESGRVKFDTSPDNVQPDSNPNALLDILKFLMKSRVKDDYALEDVDNLKKELSSLNLPTQLHIEIMELLKEYNENGKIELWKESEFSRLSTLVSRVFGVQGDVERLTSEAKDFPDLNKQMKSLIKSKIEASDSMLINLLQCLLEDWGQGNQTRRHIVDVWEKDFRENYHL